MATTRSKTRPPKSIEALGGSSSATLDEMGRSYYLYCLETALFAVVQARTIVAGDPVETNHELPLIQQLLLEAYEAA